jgi:8-oxo-dGTP pyrophosphatase MutT (NUDIX family)
MTRKFELAACIVIPTGNTIEEILAISRRNDFTKWGIPGGKQDPCETNVECACREIEEEMGITILQRDLIPLYSGACYGSDGRDFWVTTYLLDGTFSGMAVAAEEGLQVKPMEIITLCNERVSPFASYNQHVVNAWRHLR